VWLGIHVLGFSARSFALANVGLIAVWLGLAAALARRYQGLVEPPA
jgi:hypothetical protein